MQVVYEDNHIIVVNKASGEIVQGDKTGDRPLVEDVKHYLKVTYAKPGNVFCGVVHRLDRPVAGLVVFAKTSKALSRMNELFRIGAVHKTYWAITRNRPEQKSAHLTHYITTTERNNKSYASLTPRQDAKEARLSYGHIASTDRYHLLEVNLETGRKHQIRVQLSAIGCPVKGDLKYGDKRSNPDGSISLMARHIEFIHPVSGKLISLTAPVPDDPLWKALETEATQTHSDKNE
ncbi:MAG: RluA family pseudouridine synthase [Muribaculaceae bacterium]|nr:RluA family pseudouridine synthase [Muribaculaceae bacterium]